MTGYYWQGGDEVMGHTDIVEDTQDGGNVAEEAY
jgi:hypothetical protein